MFPIDRFASHDPEARLLALLMGIYFPDEADGVRFPEIPHRDVEPWRLHGNNPPRPNANPHVILSQVYEEKYAQLYRAAYAITRNAEDATQLAVFKLWRHMSACHLETCGCKDPDIVSAELYVATIRCAKDIATYRKRHIEKAQRTAETTPTQAEDPETVDLALPCDISEYISQLSPEHQEVIWLYYFADVSEQEISERLGIPVGTVKSRLSRARECLRKIIIRSFEQAQRKLPTRF